MKKVLTSKPTRHGSFSEIEIDVELDASFPIKFHRKLTAKDEALRLKLLHLILFLLQESKFWDFISDAWT